MAKTMAEQVAEMFDNDGLCWYEDEKDLGQVCESMGASWRQDGSGKNLKWSFPDGSAIVESGKAWDLGFELDDCFCWAGGHTDGCPHASPHDPFGEVDRVSRLRARIMAFAFEAAHTSDQYWPALRAAAAACGIDEQSVAYVGGRYFPISDRLLYEGSIPEDLFRFWKECASHYLDRVGRGARIILEWGA